jgi:hypothetical protein
MLRLTGLACRSTAEGLDYLCVRGVDVERHIESRTCWYSGQVLGLGREASTWIMLGTGGKDLNIRPCRASSTILDADCSYPRRTFGLGM